jgi:hypothetical protein
MTEKKVPWNNRKKVFSSDDMECIKIDEERIKLSVKICYICEVHVLFSGKILDNYLKN